MRLEVEASLVVPQGRNKEEQQQAGQQGSRAAGQSTHGGTLDPVCDTN